MVSIISLLFALLGNTFFKTLIDGYNSISILFVFIFILLIKEISTYIQNKLLIRLEYKIDEYLELDVHNKLLLLPNYYFNSRSVGDIITKFKYNT